jgi:hypothetical protein
MKTNSLHTHFIYWILPSLITLGCMLVFFYDPFGWSTIIVSKQNREFGVLEHLQSFIILIMFFYAIRGIRNKKNVVEKTIFILAALVSLFMLFEEIDYGLHYYEWMKGIESKPPEEQLRNVHNNGNITDIIKTTTNIFIAVFLIALPIINYFTKKKYPLVTYFSPTPYILTTLFCLFLLSQYAFYLYRQDFHTNRAIDGNISEFEEFMIYYAFMLYLKEMTSKDKRIPEALIKTN